MYRSFEVHVVPQGGIIRFALAKLVFPLCVNNAKVVSSWWFMADTEGRFHKCDSSVCEGFLSRSSILYGDLCHGPGNNFKAERNACRVQINIHVLRDRYAYIACLETARPESFFLRLYIHRVMPCEYSSRPRADSTNSTAGSEYICILMTCTLRAH